MCSNITTVSCIRNFVQFPKLLKLLVNHTKPSILTIIANKVIDVVGVEANRSVAVGTHVSP